MIALSICFLAYIASSGYVIWYLVKKLVETNENALTIKNPVAMVTAKGLRDDEEYEPTYVGVEEELAIQEASSNGSSTS
jgi:hypothetical protein